MSSEPQRRVRSATRASTSVMHVLIFVLSVSGRAFVVGFATKRPHDVEMSSSAADGAKTPRATSMASMRAVPSQRTTPAAHDAKTPGTGSIPPSIHARASIAADAVDEERGVGGECPSAGRERPPFVVGTLDVGDRDRRALGQVGLHRRAVARVPGIDGEPHVRRLPA